MHTKSIPGGFVPDVILVDISSVNGGLNSRYPTSKVLLVDTGVEKERIVKAILSYQIDGVLSVDTEIGLFHKALQTVTEGQIWVDNATLKAFLHQTPAAPPPPKGNGVTEREREIIDLVCRGCTNREIAASLSLSEHTIKAHLNRIFRKCNATSRSKLITLMMRQTRERTA
ncbi:MAG: response regulator transcription factor [Syntrophorhabdales bacterium]|jgi:DNA-binding NarL/FixJ family response regulator